MAFIRAVVLLRLGEDQDGTEKTRGGPETAAAEQPKLTTTTAINRASFHAERYCESRAKAVAGLQQFLCANIDKGLSDSAGICKSVRKPES